MTEQDNKTFGSAEMDPEEKEDEGKSIIEQLRSRTEEGDLEQYLKKSFGGYTKQSVMDYLSAQKKQQQTNTANFYRNIKILNEEKEALRKSNEILKSRLANAELNYENLAESISVFQMESDEFSVKDIIDLKSSKEALNDEIKKCRQEIQEMNLQLNQLDTINHELMVKLEQAGQEITAHKQMILAEKLETKNQRSLASDYFSQLEAEQKHNALLSERLANSEEVLLRKQVAELAEELAVLNALNEKILKEVEAKSGLIETQTGQMDSLKREYDLLNVAFDEANLQNEKLLHTNRALSEQLLQEYRHAVEIIRDRSEMAAEKSNAEQKLSSANEKIARLEQVLQKEKMSAALSETYHRMDNLTPEGETSNL